MSKPSHSAPKPVDLRSPRLGSPPSQSGPILGRAPSVAAGALSLSLLILACSAAEPGAEEDDGFDTKDVSSDVDSRIRPEDDARPSPREVISLVGMLPSDFPDDVWVYEPSSIVDLPAAASEERYIVFKARETLPIVAAKLEAKLAADGWSGSSLDGGQPVIFRKGDRRVVVGLVDRREETSIRVEY